MQSWAHAAWVLFRQRKQILQNWYTLQDFVSDKADMFEKKLSMLESSYLELSKLDETSRYVYGLGNVKPSTACKYMYVNNKIWKTILNF